METFFNKIEAYNIFNFLFPGIIFASILTFLIEENIYSSSLIIATFEYYFTGLVLSRIGSIVINPILEKTKIIKKEKYKNFICKEEKDTKIEILQREANQYRTFVAVFICLLLVEIYICIFVDISKINTIIYFIILIIIFVLSYRKQTNFIIQRIKERRYLKLVSKERE